jgi:hypothetical protein
MAGLFRIYESHRDDDSPAGQIHLPDARLDEGQRRAGVQLEHVVPRVLEYLAHLPEQASVLLLDAKPDELEDVELVLVAELGECGASDGELGSALDVSVEANHRTTAGAAPRGDDGRRLSPRVEHRTVREDILSLARALDEEAAVEAVRLPDTPDRD